MSEVCIRCDASPRIGFGHLTRSIALAQAFREDCGLDATLLMRVDATALGIARTAGIPVTSLPPSTAGAEDVIRPALADARALVLDYREDFEPGTIADASRRGIVIATIDDPTDRRLLADLAFYPPIPQVREWSWDGFSGELLAGWEWAVLRRDLGQPRVDRSAPPARVLVTMGGSDPLGLSAIVLEAVARLSVQHQTTLVIGPGNQQRQQLLSRAAVIGVRCVESPDRFGDLMRDTDIALVAFGVTAYELAVLRVPSLFLSISDDHAMSASAFVDAGLGRHVATHPNVTVDVVHASLRDAIEAHADPDSWMHRLPTALDGNGASRVARRIAAAMKSS